MKPFPLICAAWLVASCPSWASDQEKRFLEFPSGNDTTTFDLSTVQIIQPGRFTIISTTIDDPDVMKLELNALEILRTYCVRADRQYAASTELFTLGPPDMPVKNIEVKSTASSFPYKGVTWFYPYKRLAGRSTQRLTRVVCKQGGRSEVELYAETKTVIMNGTQTKYLYDCKRGLQNIFFNVHENPTQAITTFFVRKGTWAFEYYRSVCLAVTHEAPYVPE